MSVQQNTLQDYKGHVPQQLHMPPLTLHSLSLSSWPHTYMIAGIAGSHTWYDLVRLVSQAQVLSPEEPHLVTRLSHHLDVLGQECGRRIQAAGCWESGAPGEEAPARAVSLVSWAMYQKHRGSRGRGMWLSGGCRALKRRICKAEI
jgi:hypothetical protein